MKRRPTIAEAWQFAQDTMAETAIGRPLHIVEKGS